MNVPIRLDTRELAEYHAILRRAKDNVSRQLKPTLSKAALNIKTEMQALLRESKYFAQIAPKVSYDITAGANEARASIGVEKGGAGALHTIAYFGGAYGGGGRVDDPRELMDSEAPILEQFVADIAETAIS